MRSVPANWPLAGDVRDGLRARGGLLRAIGELLDAIDGIAHAVESVALEIDAAQHGADSMLSRQAAESDAAARAEAERQDGAS